MADVYWVNHSPGVSSKFQILFYACSNGIAAFLRVAETSNCSSRACFVERSSLFPIQFSERQKITTPFLNSANIFCIGDTAHCEDAVHFMINLQFRSERDFFKGRCFASCSTTNHCSK